MARVASAFDCGRRKAAGPLSAMTQHCHRFADRSSRVRLKRSVKKSALGFLDPAVRFDLFEKLKSAV